MTTSQYTQRWRDREHSWRHTSEGGFDKRLYDVELIAKDKPVKDFVNRHHYSGSYGSASIRAGLYEDGALVGVAVFGTPMSHKILPRAFPGLVANQESMELLRFVLLDDVPANAESWFLAQAFRLAADRGLRGVLSFADPIERRLPDGTVITPGHIGTIYQASNAFYCANRSTARAHTMGPDGRLLSPRAMQKIRKQEQGAKYAERRLVEWGATPRRPFEDPTVWMRESLAEIGAISFWHPGNHRYLFKIGRTKAERSRVTIGLTGAPYPKKVAA